MGPPNNSPQSQGPLVTVPKDNGPPPAYTPRRIPSHIASFVAQLSTTLDRQNQEMSSLARQAQETGRIGDRLFPRPAVPSMPSVVMASDDQDETSETSSPISLRINTAVNVSRSNNIVCLTATPAEQANAIAKAVVQALYEGSSGRCGIPMIDESGCPRPLNIEVDAGLVVEGTGNVIGSRDVIGELLQKRGTPPLRRSREEADDEDEGFASAKRRRSSH
ncbi:hypothetical protein FVEN_g10844 [Fusarium venenatum]|uniref:Uncharacterized protein n=1 Tax=Fusarium venenatum TaxID=56646 RepID=A0A2L2TLK4_9HYPO|nr:uncharacterized protein FVRRES_00588 [Fusarium venenatum]KAG8350997.1 hypothetical protein FVEN_g10844 [Fusarium venenatum]KAH7006175.1 hypothetical protein EDB82DRAFT_109861 [Fusarium venenatum]CEI64076.1 unnamed protein product [Fusarium venenatum]